MPNPKAVVVGVEGLSLTKREKDLIRDANPLGIILFKRNIETPEQVKALTDEFKDIANHEHPLVLVDQEGGRVRRFRPPHWFYIPPANDYLLKADGDMEQAKAWAYTAHRIMGYELQAMGVNVDCAPMIDVRDAKADDIIGDRAFSENADEVAILGEASAEGLKDSAVLPVIKHLPGHGRATVDSHEALPEVNTPLAQLQAKDFKPFKALNRELFAMTAHIVYHAIDNEVPVTFSKAGLAKVRELTGFNGLIFSDDLAMKALKGSYVSRTKRALEAGCDLLLHCNLDIERLEEVMEHIPNMPDESVQLLASHLADLSFKPFDFEQAKAEFTSLFPNPA